MKFCYNNYYMYFKFKLFCQFNLSHVLLMRKKLLIHDIVKLQSLEIDEVSSQNCFSYATITRFLDLLFNIFIITIKKCSNALMMKNV